MESAMSRSIERRLRPGLAAILLAAGLLLGCKGSVETTSPPSVPTANPTQQARVLTDTAEAQFLPNMTADLQKLVRAQPWFTQLTQAHVDLIQQIMKCERAAKAKGETESVRTMLTVASEQGWYSDGLDEAEARGLRGAFATYTESLSNHNAPAIGPVLATTLKYGLFRAVDLKEGGEMILVVSADDPAVGQSIIDMAVDALPQIEALVGAYPYKFLHIVVTDLGDFYAGLSYDQFIAINPISVDKGTVVHELTHSTMYGKFPIWFEEGFAHFVEYYLTDNLAGGIKQFNADLKYLGTDTKLYVGAYRSEGVAGYIAEREQGFMFMNAVFEMQGIEGVTDAVRALRTHSLGDQELLRQFVQHGTPEQQAKMKAYFCKNVVGTARNYC
jgi:hypothetical protein